MVCLRLRNPVLIPATTNDPVIGSGTSFAKSIEINGSGASLTVNGDATLTVSAEASTIIISNSGQLTNRGTINATNTTPTTNSTVAFELGVNVTVDNYGTLNLTASQNNGIVIGTNSTFQNYSGGNIVINARGGIRGGTGTLINNAGATITVVGSNSGIQTNGTVNNSGFIDVTGTMECNSGTQITNNACGIIKLTGDYFNGTQTTTNNGFISIGGTLHNPLGTFTNNGVLKYLALNASSSFTNNKMLITNTCPIFTLGGTNNYTVNGIFTDAGATTSAGTYTSVGNIFIANNTIPTGTQTLYAQVTDATCTFVVPFSFNNVKPTAVSVNNTSVCAGTSVTLSATCASGTITWYDAASGTSIALGTGTGLTTIPVTNPTTYYASCEVTNCVSGRVATSAVTVTANPSSPTGTENPTICNNTTASLSATCATGSPVWYDASSVAIPFTGSPFVTPNLSTTTTYNVRCESGTCNSTFATVRVTIQNVATFVAPTITQPTCSVPTGTIVVNLSGSTIITGALEVTDPTQTGRLNRNGVPSTCAGKGFPGLSSTSGERAYKSYTYTNTTASPQCISVTLNTSGTNLFFVTYLGSFVPYSLSTNYLGDVGASSVSSTAAQTLAAGATMVIVVHDVNPPAGIGVNYTLTINNIAYSAFEFSKDNGANWQASNTFSGLASGDYNLAYRQIGTTCAKTYGNNPVTITAPTISAPNGTENASICNNTTTSLSATCTTGNPVWYDASSVAIPFTGSPFVTPNLSTTTTYNVRCESGTCNSAFVPVTVSINPTATATETMTWTGTVSTDWNNACNWSPNGVPTATNAV